MKNLKALFALMFLVGLMGVSHVFACKFPGEGSVARGYQKPVSKEEVQSMVPILDNDSTVYGKRDLVGRYASLATATFFDPVSNRTQYATCVGMVTFDGRGHFTDVEVHSYDGTIVRDQFTGTYSIGSDGRGTMHFVGENETYDYEFVMSSGVKEMTFLVTLDIPGVVSYGTLKKQQ